MGPTPPYGNSIFLRYLFSHTQHELGKLWHSWGVVGILQRSRLERLHQSSMNFDRTQQDPGARLLVVLACPVVVVYGLPVIMNVAAVGLLILFASQSVSEPVGG